jgi:hypothetical protein
MYVWVIDLGKREFGFAESSGILVTPLPYLTRYQSGPLAERLSVVDPEGRQSASGERIAKTVCIFDFHNPRVVDVHTKGRWLNFFGCDFDPFDSSRRHDLPSCRQLISAGWYIEKGNGAGVAGLRLKDTVYGT